MNAKEEFLNFIELKADVLCAQLTYDNGWNEKASLFNLPTKYTNNEYEAFLKSIDFNYDDGYGTQELYGTIWFCDGSWATRGEYDGSEWWVHNSLPEIPKYLKVK